MFYAHGSRLGDEKVLNSIWTGDQFHPSVAIFDSDHIGAAWVSRQVPYMDSAFYFRVFDSQGVAYRNDNLLVYSQSRGDGSRQYPVVCTTDHGFIVAYLVRYPSSSSMLAKLELQRFTLEGMETGDPAVVTSAHPYYKVLPGGGTERVIVNLGEFDISCTGDGYIVSVVGRYEEDQGHRAELSIIAPDNTFYLYPQDISGWQTKNADSSVALSHDESYIRLVYETGGDATDLHNDTVLLKEYVFGSPTPDVEARIDDPSSDDHYNFRPQISMGKSQTVVVWRQMEKLDPGARRVRAVRLDGALQPLGWEEFGGQTEVTLDSRYEVAESSRDQLIARSSVSTPDDQGRFVVAWTASRLGGVDLDPVIRCLTPKERASLAALIGTTTAWSMNMTVIL